MMQVERPLLDRDKDRKVMIENMIIINIHYGGIFLFFFPFTKRLSEKKIKAWATTMRLVAKIAFYYCTN